MFINPQKPYLSRKHLWMEYLYCFSSESVCFLSDKVCQLSVCKNGFPRCFVCCFFPLSRQFKAERLGGNKGGSLGRDMQPMTL